MHTRIAGLSQLIYVLLALVILAVGCAPQTGEAADSGSLIILHTNDVIGYIDTCG